MIKSKVGLSLILTLALASVVGLSTIASAGDPPPPPPPGGINVSGTVKNIDTGAIISGATISDGTQTVHSDTTGNYVLAEAAGKHTLTTSASGYLKTEQICTVVSTPLTVNWSLTKTYGTQTPPAYAQNMKYAVFAWNDLGMHCDQNDYSYFSVLPPFNTLHVQVLNRSVPQSQTSGLTVSYTFPKKTNSTLH
ncbi:MAG TPA: hypothetical protein DD730_10715, partial [Desulfosporosinus sp.]|nr:hypothetical protein [Desulfosporosinus sp.]